MTTTYCVGAVARELRAHSRITATVLRGIVAQQPDICPHGGCAPGGCRKHVIEYLTGVALRAGIPMRGRT